MEATMHTSKVLLLFLITGTHLSPLMLERKGGSASFMCYLSADNMLYRVSEDGDLLLVSCSQPEAPQPDGYHVECGGNRRSCYLRMKNLTLSQSGDYRVEKDWKGHIKDHRSFRLIVCAEGDDSILWERRRYDERTVLCKPDSTPANGTSLQLYRSTALSSSKTLVLDTSSSLEPLEEDLRGRLQVDLNSFTVTLSAITFADSYWIYHCTVWKGAQCQRLDNRKITIVPADVFAREEEILTLPCFLKQDLPGNVYWSTPIGPIQQTRQQEVMYMLNGRPGRNYSLIIPSVSLQHAGRYKCQGAFNLNREINLYVCQASQAKVFPMVVMFLHGESVLLENSAISSFPFLKGAQWYRQTVLQPMVLIADLYNKSVPIPEDLRGRVTVSESRNNSLIISNLTSEDSGLYTWRVFGFKGLKQFNCSEGTIRLVYRDPFGVDSPFYRASALLMGCGLLGLVTAVIWFNLRSRRGETSGQKSGDEDLHDDVEVAEDSV